MPQSRNTLRCPNLINFEHFAVVTAQIIPLDKPVAPTAQQLSAISGAPRESICSGHICIKGLALSLLQAQACSNHFTGKGEAMYRAITFLIGTGWTVSQVCLPHTYDFNRDWHHRAVLCVCSDKEVNKPKLHFWNTEQFRTIIFDEEIYKTQNNSYASYGLVSKISEY